jgi:hypothetical protein
MSDLSNPPDSFGPGDWAGPGELTGEEFDGPYFRYLVVAYRTGGGRRYRYMKSEFDDPPVALSCSGWFSDHAKAWSAACDAAAAEEFERAMEKDD